MLHISTGSCFSLTCPSHLYLRAALPWIRSGGLCISCVLLMPPFCSQKLPTQLLSVDPASSIRMHYDGWAGSWVNLHIWGSAFPCGVSCNEYGLLRLDRFFSALSGSAERSCCLPGHSRTGRWFPKWNPCLMLVDFGTLQFLCPISLPLNLGPTLMCASHPGLMAVADTLVLCAQWGLHRNPSLLSCPLGLWWVWSCAWLFFVLLHPCPVSIVC